MNFFLSFTQSLNGFYLYTELKCFIVSYTASNRLTVAVSSSFLFMDDCGVFN